MNFSTGLPLQCEIGTPIVSRLCMGRWIFEKREEREESHKKLTAC
jgi:hypothetical protein